MKTRSSNPFIVIAAVLLANGSLLLTADAVFAQGSGQAGASERLIEEIVVTAQKRAQSIQEVPIAITAFDGELQKELGWDTPLDMIAQAPNVIGQSLFGTTQPTFFIRGIGTTDQHHSAQSPVGVYVDEVYVNSTVAQGFQLFDLQRIEVLRGPQGTLWGKNTTGGAMHFVTADPSQESLGNISATYALFNEDTTDVNFEGYINRPLVEDKLAARVSFNVRNRDGWVLNEFDGSDIGERNRFSARLGLSYTPTDNFDAVLKASIGRQRGDHVVLHHVFNPSPASFLVLPYQENPAIDVVSQDHDAPEDVDFGSASLRLNWSGDYGTVTAISGYIEVERDENADVDASPFDTGFGPFVSDSEQWSQEVRFTSPEEERFRYILGAFLFNETIDGSTTIGDGPDGFGIFCPPADHCAVQNFEDRERDSYAVFANIDYDLSDNLSLNAGVRWTQDEETLGLRLVSYNFNGERSLEGNLRGAIGPLNESANTTLDEEWDEFTGNVTLSYNLSDDAHVYGRVARGYLAGTHVIPFVFPTEIATLDPEEVDSFEVGVKTLTLDGSLQLNVAAFVYDYSNIQVSRIDPEAAGTGVRRENAAEADIWGVEVEAVYQPTNRLRLSGGLGYTDAEYSQFLSFDPGTGTINDFSGNQLLNTPEWNANLFALYTIPLEVGALELQSDWTYQDDVFFNPDNNPVEIGESRTLGNFALRYVSEAGDWSVEAFVRNLTDEEYIVNERNFSSFWGLNLRIVGDPRVVGLRLDMSF